MSDDTLFEGFDPPTELAPDDMSAGQRLTRRQQQDVSNGVHPLTHGPLHPEASTMRSSTSGSKDPFTCGTCVHRVHQHGGGGGDYPKCDALGPKALTHSAATDVRAWWPACREYHHNPVGRRDDHDMLRTAWVSEDGRYRYSLTRGWDEGDDALTFVMLNPSTADALEDDPTIRRCVGFAREFGYAGIEVVNLYAYRATKPADLWLADDPVGPNNDTVLKQALRRAAQLALPVIAAWGANAKRDRVAWLMAQPGSEVLQALRVTLAGHPGHPLYLPATCRPAPWPGVR